VKLALLTGGSSGLGKALADLLARKNIETVTPSRSFCDLANDRGPILRLIREKKPDLVINNAGFTFYGPALSHSQKEIFEVNAAAALEITLEAARTLRSENRPGVILNVSSIAGEFPCPNMAVYAASKAFLTSFSQSFDGEMRPFGIRILAALPGQIATPFANKASQGRFSQTPSLFALRPESAAEQIWKQIENRNPIAIIDWRYRLAFSLASLLPKRWIGNLIGRNIATRI
jgi:hypothetical protein